MNINIDRITGMVTSSPFSLTYPVVVADDFTLSKVIEVQEGEKQKSNEAGKLLYLDSEGNETIESKTVTRTEEKEVTNTYIDDEGIEHTGTVKVLEPTEWIDNEPVMIPNIEEKTVTFSENPTEFTVEEILQAKYQSLLDSSNYDYILADIFLNEDDIDLTDKDHAANTGVAIMQLLPNGQAKTKTITLEAEVSSFELLELECSGVDVYINDVKLINNKAALSNPTNEVVIKFMNTTNKSVDVKSYAIAY